MSVNVLDGAAARLRAVGLVKRFGPRAALAGLHLDVRAGQVLGLLGPNGAGKSTFVRVLLGLERADAGALLVDGAPPARGWLRRVGVAPQELAVHDELTGLENLSLFARLHGLSGQVLRERVDRALAVGGLLERARTRVEGWSGGMKRRLNLAAAVVHDPDLLVLDEPTVGVDAASRVAILDEVRRRARAGAAVLLATHHLDEVLRTCDRVAVLSQGRVVAEGEPASIAARGAEEAEGAGLERLLLQLSQGQADG